MAGVAHTLVRATESNFRQSNLFQIKKEPDHEKEVLCFVFCSLFFFLFCFGFGSVQDMKGDGFTLTRQL
jgi:hypothetical protein